jgi:hypothetical protein
MIATAEQLVFCGACGAREDLCECIPSRPAFVGEKNPITAALLSLLIPGLGQLYNGEGAKALVFFIGWVFIIGWPLAVMEAYYSARVSNLEARLRQAGSY